MRDRAAGARDRARSPSLTVVVFVGIAIQAKYAMWNTQILSESLAISLGFVAVAAWWRFAAAPTQARALLGFAFSVAWLVVRDAHVLPGTVVIVPVVLLVAWLGAQPRPRPPPHAGHRRASSWSSSPAYSYVATGTSQRAELSFHDVVGLRVLPDHAAHQVLRPARHAARRRAAHAHRQGRPRRQLLHLHGSRVREVPALGPGSRARARSCFRSYVLSPHYLHLLYDDLPTLLAGDVSYYDTQSVFVRMPHEMPLQLGGPSTRKGLTIWLGAAVAALVATFVLARRRKRSAGLAVFGAAALLLTLTELYMTWGGDPVEMQRHMIGNLSRLSVILVIVIAIGLDALITERARPAEPAPTEVRDRRSAGGRRRCVSPRLPTPADVIRWLTVFALTIVGGVTLIGNKVQAAQNDAVFTQSLVNRAARFGGTYYQNGITPKGPLEDVAHDIALRVGGYDGHWYVISVMVAISAALIGGGGGAYGADDGREPARRAGGRDGGVRALHAVRRRLCRACCTAGTSW